MDGDAACTLDDSHTLQRSECTSMLAHTSPSIGSVAIGPSLRKSQVKTMAGTSFDDLDLEDIVDPFMLSPRIPYPPTSVKYLSEAQGARDRVRGRKNIAQSSAHARSRSLGTLTDTWPSLPPQAELPPIPLGRNGSRDSQMPSVASRPDLKGGVGLLGKQYAFMAATQYEATPSGVVKVSDAHLSTSFLSTRYSTIESQSSEPSEDDASQVFHTAPVSPAGKPDLPTPSTSAGEAAACRPYKHARQSSSTSTLRMRLAKPLFRRPHPHDADISSDSGEESEPLATPTDPISRHSRHKRGSSFFKVLDKLKSGI